MRLLKGMLAGLLLSSLVGCGTGGGTYPVKGTVKYQDGTPVTKGNVNFDSGESIASGNINPDGTYILSSLGEDDGAPPGTYTVYFSGEAVGGYPPGAKALVSKKYHAVSTSDLKKEVKAEENTIDIEVPKP